MLLPDGEFVRERDPFFLPALIEVHQVRLWQSHAARVLDSTSARRPVADVCCPASRPDRLDRQTLYGGVGDDSHLTGIPSEDAIRSVVERCYEVDAGTSKGRDGLLRPTRCVTVSPSG